MAKTILITGATDGIGLLTAQMLAAEGHRVLLHGRNAEKLEAAAKEIGGESENYLADLSRFDDVVALAKTVLAHHARLDVLINNAGVLKTAQPRTREGLDVRFVVNTLAPFLLSRQLLPIIPREGRVVNVASAAQAPVNIPALLGKRQLADMEAYAQSKLALIMWTQWMANEHPDGPVFTAINPGSLLATKMVREGFGVSGHDVRIGAGILRRAALSDEFVNASGRYFDNDNARFAAPHPDAANPDKITQVVEAIDDLIASFTAQ